MTTDYLRNAKVLIVDDEPANVRLLERILALAGCHQVAADGLKLPFSEGTFDAVTIAFGLRNMASWTAALSEMRRILRPDGHVLILDFSVPLPPLRWVYRPYLHHVLPRVAALLTGRKAAYDYLGDSIEQFPQGPAMCALLEEAGFDEPECQPLSGGIVSLYTAKRG